MSIKDKFYCDTCECSPCCCFERMLWDDEGGQLDRHYEPEMEVQINKALDKQEEDEDEEAKPL